MKRIFILSIVLTLLLTACGGTEMLQKAGFIPANILSRFFLTVISIR